MRELTHVVGNDCAVEIDANSYSVPWRLIGERMAVTIVAGEVRIRHGLHQVAVCNRMGAGCGSSTPLISMELLVAMARSARLRSRRSWRRPHRRRCYACAAAIRVRLSS
ncbi:Mu transposase domain-containing protein [Bradyrhizobium elkanii]|uniref:Mu transposase domain-containing protein n=1 Tax=Bradyrhizobium elkanii TaxID=29448 RepID=UPI003D1E1F4F